MQVTVLDESAQPPQTVAQRIAYVPPGRSLQVKSSAADHEYQPGSAAEIEVEVTDESQRPTRAMLAATLVPEAQWQAASDSLVRSGADDVGCINATRCHKNAVFATAHESRNLSA